MQNFLVLRVLPWIAEKSTRRRNKSQKFSFFRVCFFTSLNLPRHQTFFSRFFKCPDTFLVNNLSFQVNKMCGWSKRMLLPFVICVSFCVNSVVAISRRPPLRVYRKLNSISSSSSSSLLPLPPRLAFMPPRVAAAQNFHPEYELPPFMMSKPSISTSYDVPMIPSSDYGPPRPSTEYGLPQPPSDYGASRPSTDYGPPRPSSDYGMSFPSSDYGAPMLSTKYGPPKNVKMKPIVHKHIYVHIPPPEPEAYTSRQAKMFEFPMTKSMTISLQSTDNHSSATKALQNCVHQSTDATGADCTRNSTSAVGRRKDIGLRSREETWRPAQYCYSDTCVNAAEQARSLFHSIQGTGLKQSMKFLDLKLKLIRIFFERMRAMDHIRQVMWTSIVLH